MPDVTKTNPLTRRGLLARAGLVGAAALGAGLLDDAPAEGSQNKQAAFGPTTGQKRFAVDDLDILTFALNMEYFEAEFYLRAVNGEGLPDTQVTGGLGYGPGPDRAVTPGLVSTYTSGTSSVVTGTNTPVTFDADGTIRAFAAEMAQDASDHVTLLRKSLTKRAPARPAIDLATAFTAFMRTAGVIGASDTFDPFASQRNFLLASFLINDIGPTAYVGAAPYIAGPTNLSVAAGILGTKSYHAGLIRTLLFSQSQEQDDQDLLVSAGAIANLRNTLAINGGAANPNDAGLVDASVHASIIPADGDAIIYARGFPAILSLFYQSGKATLAPAAGGFAPSGFNGRIR